MAGRGSWFRALGWFALPDKADGFEPLEIGILGPKGGVMGAGRGQDHAVGQGQFAFVADLGGEQREGEILTSGGCTSEHRARAR